MFLFLCPGLKFSTGGRPPLHSLGTAATPFRGLSPCFFPRLGWVFPVTRFQGTPPKKIGDAHLCDVLSCFAGEKLPFG